MIDDVMRRISELNQEWDIKAISWGDIDEKSIVWDVGSYRGRWAYQMMERYNPIMYCFEPQQWAYDVSCQVLEPFIKRMVMCNYGLGVLNAVIPMGEFETDGCGFTVTTRKQGQGLMRDVFEVWQGFDSPKIDLMMMNIEGGEYYLLPYLFAMGIKPKRLLLQTHDGFYNPDMNAKKSIHLRELLMSVYGDPIWDYGWTLSCWEAIND